MDVKECYEQIGGNYMDVLQRLRNDLRIVKYLAKFVEDQSYEHLCHAIDATDYETAFRTAHTLKGMCMNLGLICLQKSSSALTENLRTGEADEDTAALFEKTSADYFHTITAIQSLTDAY